MADDDNTVIPLWKRNLDKRGPGAAAKAAATRLTLKTIDEAMYSALDKIGAEAFFLRFINGTGEHQRAFLQYLGKRLPTEVNGHLDHALTVKIVKQVGEREIVIEGGPAAHLKRPPKDAVTGERLPVVSHTDSGLLVDPVDA